MILGGFAFDDFGVPLTAFSGGTFALLVCLDEILFGDDRVGVIVASFDERDDRAFLTPFAPTEERGSAESPGRSEALRTSAALARGCELLKTDVACESIG